MRRTCSIFVTWALFLGFVEAPFAHVHEHASGDDHHATEQVHAHSLHIPNKGTLPAFDDTDPAVDERLLSWFQTVQRSGFVLFFAPRQTGLIAPLNAGEFVRAAPSICSHDPPLTSQLPARSPPAIPA